MEYGGPSSEYESDCSTDEYGSSITSRPTWDSDNSNGSFLEGFGDEEVMIPGGLWRKIIRERDC